jgi:phytoene desaturase
MDHHHKHMKQAVIIGSGMGGLGIAAILAKAGYAVDVFEKNEQAGGRASVFSAQGYTFDMGPSWYLMPDVFADFFSLLGERIEDHLDLVRLDPSYRVFFSGSGKRVDMSSDVEKVVPIFESIEAGSGAALRAYLRASQEQYDIAKRDFLYRNYDSIFDLINRRTLAEGHKLSVLSTMDRYVRRFFTSEELQKILQYTLVFLGSSPYDTPALYNIMSHIDFNLGVYYPRGGIYRVVQAIRSIAEKHGARFHLEAPVSRIIVEDGIAKGIRLEDGRTIMADIVVSDADLAYTEQELLPPEAREHTAAYWSSRVMAPSAFILYLGVRGRVPQLVHHNLIFSHDWRKNFSEIFDTPRWPTEPSLYVCAPSVTDPSVAPEGHENLFILVPIAAGLETTKEQLETYALRTISYIEKEMGIEDLADRVEFQRIFCVEDFAKRYHSYRGSALGFAHTLRQSAIFRPKNTNKKAKNLYYVGASVNPGIGMPTCLISAELAWKRIRNDRSAGHRTTL